ncbi:hypothetical protein EXIGLDRAFT_272005 [Exidia glandulosa HHB12029]|uniref:Uncharacterized protein n=1 Tax=Exidia glandulosa HHB12029 TaxID=1314781 RepID=A0A165DME5_EXIGL|nr:hypothetical protein EXIGLDRAFT_272005 [Exidia glandulosa HHB12029]
MATDEPMDICSDAVTMSILFHHLQRICVVAKYNDVRMSDLYDPDPDRTIKILSAIMNVCQFALERGELFDRLRDESKRVMEEQDLVEQELAEMKAKVAAIKAARKREEPIVQQLEAEAQALQEQLAIAYNEQQEVVHESAANKQERNALLSKLEQLKYERQVAFDTNADLKSRIVDEPEKIKFMITEMTRQATQYRQNIADNEAKARELRTKADRAVAYEQDIRAVTQVLVKVEEQQTALAAATNKFNDLKAELDQRKVEQSELQMKHTRTLKKLENAQARLRDASDTAQRKRDASEKAITRLRAEYAQMSSERKENDADVEETKKQIEAVEREMATHLRENEAQINEMLQEYARLRHQVDVYVEMLSTQMGFQVEL